MNTLTFQYFSDLHLEFYNNNISKVRRIFKVQNTTAQFLLLAGDIGQPSQKSYVTFLNDLSLQFERVFVITGNHEYYKMHMSTSVVDNFCRELCRNIPQQNITFLQNESYMLKDNLHIYGSTFWTHIPHEKQNDVMSSMNDYCCIADITPQKSNELHQKSKVTLSNLLNSLHRDDKCIVMTHHLPCFDLIDSCYRTPKHKDINLAFASDNQALTADRRIVAWVYGHTHKPVQKGKFYCNPIGYPGENKEWTLEKYFDVNI